jgi:nucleoside-diphosphate-sugar epimerase
VSPHRGENGAVLVTGAAGFLGSSLVDRLVAEGRRTLALDFALDEVDDGTRRSRRGSPYDPDAVGALLGEEPVDAVVHLAAHPDVPFDAATTPAILRANVEGTHAVLAAADRCPRRPRVVLASSIKVYGPASPPLRETTPIEPTSVYALSKAAADRLGLLFHRQRQLEVCVLRFAQIYGPGQPAGMLIAQVLDAARRGEALDMTGGEQTRDLLFVADAVEAIVRALRAPQAVGRVVNVGTGVEVSIRDVVLELASLLPEAPRPRLGALAYRDGEMWRQVVDPATARELLGFEAGVPLAEGLRRTVDAHRKRLAGSEDAG